MGFIHSTCAQFAQPFFVEEGGFWSAIERHILNGKRPALPAVRYEPLFPMLLLPAFLSAY